MSLIKCPECEKMFSDKASACPNCACPIDEIVKKETEINNNNDNNKKIICPKCKFENADTDNYCFKCGVLLPRIDYNKNYNELSQQEREYFFENFINKNKQTELNIYMILVILFTVISMAVGLFSILFPIITGVFNFFLPFLLLISLLLTWCFYKTMINTVNECYKSHKSELERKKRINIRKS